MRTDNISLAESEQIIKKFFQVKFDTKKIVKVFKQTYFLLYLDDKEEWC